MRSDRKRRQRPSTSVDMDAGMEEGEVNTPITSNRPLRERNAIDDDPLIHTFNYMAEPHYSPIIDPVTIDITNDDEVPTIITGTCRSSSPNINFPVTPESTDHVFLEDNHDLFNHSAWNPPTKNLMTKMDNIARENLQFAKTINDCEKLVKKKTEENLKLVTTNNGLTNEVGVFQNDLIRLSSEISKNTSDANARKEAHKKCSTLLTEARQKNQALHHKNETLAANLDRANKELAKIKSDPNWSSDFNTTSTTVQTVDITSEQLMKTCDYTGHTSTLGTMPKIPRLHKLDSHLTSDNTPTQQANFIPFINMPPPAQQPSTQIPTSSSTPQNGPPAADEPSTTTQQAAKIATIEVSIAQSTIHMEMVSKALARILEKDQHRQVDERNARRDRSADGSGSDPVQPRRDNNNPRTNQRPNDDNERKGYQGKHFIENYNPRNNNNRGNDRRDDRTDRPDRGRTGGNYNNNNN